MATSKKEVRHGTAQAKVNGDDEMLRTGFINGTPLEAGKIADSQPVDLFSQARHVAAAQQQEDRRKIAESEPVNLFSEAGRVSQANNNNDDNNNNQQQQQQQQYVGRQGMAEPTGGGRRLDRQA